MAWLTPIIKRIAYVPYDSELLCIRWPDVIVEL